MWLKGIEDKVTFRPKFSSAINYILNDEEGFKTFMVDPRIELTNNGAERNFRKWCVNRSRSKFYVSSRGAEAGAKIYSLMMTTKNNGCNVYAYFNYLFENIRYEEVLSKYLPYNKDLPEYCKLNTSKQMKQRIKALDNSLNQ